VSGGVPPPRLRVAPDVAEAVATGRPVVALESAILTHGLPRPVNVELAQSLEKGLRDRSVMPATVGVVGGIPTVGLSAAEIELLGQQGDVDKASTRELPLVMARQAHAGTTVAATATLARRAGVRLMATGGIGGVHRDASETFDESADVPALAGTPITVVCAGVKSILDVPATLERLETAGVTVVGYRTRRFPGFYVTDSGSPVSATVAGPDEVAEAMRAADGLGLASAILVANPVPEADQLEPAVHDAAVADALRAAAAQGIRGPQLTPFLLDYLQRATAGASLAANIAAVRHNVAVAADIAEAWAKGAT
jgi:pseudouridine-5'-phosphate glycosidase